MLSWIISWTEGLPLEDQTSHPFPFVEPVQLGTSKPYLKKKTIYLARSVNCSIFYTLNTLYKRYLEDILTSQSFLIGVTKYFNPNNLVVAKKWLKIHEKNAESTPFS